MGIALDDDLDEPSRVPTPQALRAVAAIIREDYPLVAAAPEERIVGHRDVRADRTCPGPSWAAWRRRLIALV